MNELIEEFFGPYNDLAPDKLDDGLRTQLNDWIRALKLRNSYLVPSPLPPWTSILVCLCAERSPSK